MRLDMSQQVRMLQQMKLAPRMIQSMEILQLPVLALEERIRQEAEQNPTLELGTSSVETPTTDLEAEYGITESPTAETNGKKEDGPTEQEFDAFEQLNQEFNDYDYLPSHKPSRLAGIELSDKKQDAMQNMADRPQSLEDHLLKQMSLVETTPSILAFAKYLVANLDNRGFLNSPFDDIVASYGETISEDDAFEALDLVQHLEPPGVGAQDLRDCLLLQLDNPEPTMQHVEVLRTIIGNHLEDLEHNRFPLIERKTGFSLDLIRTALAEMKDLNLNPGAAFIHAETQYVVPDVTVERGQEGDFVIKMNDDNTPNVYISRHFQRMLQEKGNDPKVVEYVRKKITAARWLIDSIEQRRNTLEKVTRAIIDHQHEFLDKGPDFIEPLKMQQIADRVGVHVTTVSRAVDDKWIQTPRGIFPLKRFFGGGTVTDTGEEVAWDTIKRKLTDIISEEDKANPYSDDELVGKLKEHGYPLARRTVTKYRKMLSIPSSRQRKHHI